MYNNSWVASRAQYADGRSNSVESLLELLKVELTVFLMSAIPVIELRGGIPMGVALGLSPLNAAVICYFGSLLPAPFILLALKPVFELLRKTNTFRHVVDRFATHSLEKNGDKVQRYGMWGLMIFVAIPLPGTGVWSGSIAAALLGIPFKRSFPAIAAGNALAAIAVTLISQGVFRVLG